MPRALTVRLPAPPEDEVDHAGDAGIYADPRCRGCSDSGSTFWGPRMRITRIRCGVALIVSLSCTVLSHGAPVRLRHLTACATQTKRPANKEKPGATSGSTSKKNGILHLRGTLVEGGAECQRFRASNNKFYTLVGDLRGFRTGDEVEITGKIPQVSHCMQDMTIEVKTIRLAGPPASPPNNKPKSPV